MNSKCLTSSQKSLACEDPRVTQVTVNGIETVPVTVSHGSRRWRREGTET